MDDTKIGFVSIKKEIAQQICKETVDVINKIRSKKEQCFIENFQTEYNRKKAKSIITKLKLLFGIDTKALDYSETKAYLDKLSKNDFDNSICLYSKYDYRSRSNVYENEESDVISIWSCCVEYIGESILIDVKKWSNILHIHRKKNENNN